MYGKHFQSMYTGSMYGAGLNVFAVWGWIISHARGDSQEVELCTPMVANMLGCKVEEVESALEYLSKPDPKTRDSETGDDGRRIVKTGAFTYVVPKISKYRSIRNDEERRAYNRVKQAEHRAKNKMSNYVSLTVNDMSAVSTNERGERTEERGEEVKLKPSRIKLPDGQFIEALKTNPAYDGINIDTELGKMDAWLLANPGRKKTRQFVIKWLNRIDKPLEIGKGKVYGC